MRRRSGSAIFCIALAGLLAASGAAAAAVRTSPQDTTTSGGGSGGAKPPVYSFGVVGGQGKFLQLAHHVPTEVRGIKGKIVQIATSNSDSYALTSEGTVWAWGAGGEGELGNGSRRKVGGKPVEVAFPAGVKITSLANPMPYDSGLAIDSSGTAWGWGYNSSHSLCLPSLRIVTPERLPLSDVTMATGAGAHSLLLSHGQLFACGLGVDGELGNGTTASTSIPTAVIGLPRGRIVSIQSSWQGSGALMADGSYYDWGFNKDGQLGDGTTENSSIPERVALSGPVVAVSQGGSTRHNGQTLALLADGSVWDWGANRAGQLGDGTTHRSLLPLKVSLPSGHDWVAVCSGGYSSYVIDDSGHVWAWGGNSYGQLGIGIYRTYQKTPALVRAKLSQMSATASNAAGLKMNLSTGTGATATR